MRNRIQKLPKLLWVGDQTQNTTYVLWYKDDKPFKHTFEDPADAVGAVVKCQANGIEAFAATYIEEDKQLEVIAFSEVGRFAEFVYIPSVTRSVERAKKMVFGDNIPKFQMIKEG